MSEKILFPVGRLVQGSLYHGQTTDAEGNPLIIKTGEKMGQPRVNYYFAVAIPKGTEKHWAETDWGKKIWEIGHKGFPQGQANNPAFAWKITNGDDQVPNRKGRRPCDKEGYPGHWVLNFSNGFGCAIYNKDGSQQLLQEDFVNPGDYIQVYGNVEANGSQQQPGIFLNHSMVAFYGHGQPIILGIDPKSVGFGQCPMPAGASTMPQAGSFNPMDVSSILPAPSAPTSSMPAAPLPTPHVGILNPPGISVPPMPSSIPVQAPTHIMTTKANGISYEEYIANGWTDQLLIQHGMMQG